LPMNNPEMNGDMLPGGPNADQNPNAQEFKPDQFMQNQEQYEMKKKMRFMQPSMPAGVSGQGPAMAGLPGG
jgi:hypothetical protein